jgi:hypothetical protein
MVVKPGCSPYGCVLCCRSGGPCSGKGLYGGSFDQWTDGGYGGAACYDGGVKWLNSTSPEVRPHHTALLDD